MVSIIPRRLDRIVRLTVERTDWRGISTVINRFAGEVTGQNGAPVILDLRRVGGTTFMHNIAWIGGTYPVNSTSSAAKEIRWRDFIDLLFVMYKILSSIKPYVDFPFLIIADMKFTKNISIFYLPSHHFLHFILLEKKTLRWVVLLLQEMKINLRRTPLIYSQQQGLDPV